MNLHYMALFMIPDSVINKLVPVQYNFDWKRKRMHLTGGSEIVNPEGRGFVEERNWALLVNVGGDLAWRKMLCGSKLKFFSLSFFHDVGIPVVFLPDKSIPLGASMTLQHTCTR